MTLLKYLAESGSDILLNRDVTTVGLRVSPGLRLRPLPPRPVAEAEEADALAMGRVVHPGIVAGAAETEAGRWTGGGAELVGREGGTVIVRGSTWPERS